MKRIRTILTLVAMALIPIVANAETKSDSKEKKNEDKVYVFGVGSAFGDSIVHFTSIIELKDIKLQKKTKFLPFRQVFSLQMKTYLEGTLGYMKQTCCVFYSDSKKKISKKYYKLKKAYLEESGSKVEVIGEELFVFQVPRIQTGETE